MERIDLSVEVGRFLSALRALPRAVEQDVEAIEKSVKDKFEITHLVADNPFTSLGIAGAVGVLASGAIKLPNLTDPNTPHQKLALLDNPIFTTVTTVALTAVLKAITDKIERSLAA